LQCVSFSSEVTQLQLKGKVSEEELDDVRRVARSKWYWPKLVMANWYGLAVLCIALWGSIAGLLGLIHPNWSAIALLWLIVFLFFGFALYSVKRRRVKEFQQLNSTLPDWISIAENGVNLNGPNGATGSWPWNNFKGWREGSRVVLLDLQSGAFVILPVTDLSDVERQSLSRIMQLHIAESRAS
jgi:hypothetical protein